MTLGGATWIRNGIEFDYNFEESIRCLQAFCDEIVVLDAGSSDGTAERLSQFEDTNTMVICLDKSEWGNQQGREKLAYFQNLAKSFLSTDYYFMLQADEILHESSFPFVREAIETGEDGIICSRINLWRDCNSYLCVPENRQPCSTRVIRLAKTQFDSVDDGESISANSISKFADDIRIYHMGFVRSKKVMVDKIKNMQINVFRLSEFDPKMNNMDIFDWSAWFSENDLGDIKEPLPKFITKWAQTRP